MDPELIAYLDRRFEYLDRRFDGIDSRFEAVDRRFEAVDRRFEGVDRRFEDVDRRFEDVDQRIREVHVLIEGMDHKIELVAEGVIATGKAAEQQFRELGSEMERQFDELKALNRFSYAELDRRLRDHDRRISDLEAR